MASSTGGSALIGSEVPEGGRRLRIVGNSGQDRAVNFVMHAVGDFSSAAVGDAPRLGWLVEHGWAYVLTDVGAGRVPLQSDVDAASDGMELPREHFGAAAGAVDIVVAHAVQPTATTAPLTMAWVLDVDVDSFGRARDPGNKGPWIYLDLHLFFLSARKLCR